MKVGILQAELMIVAAHSLKEKRKVVKSLKERLFSRFNVSVAEVGAQDLWQRAVIGVSLVALNTPTAHSQLSKVENFIRSHPGASVLNLYAEIIDPEHFDPDHTTPVESVDSEDYDRRFERYTSAEDLLEDE